MGGGKEKRPERNAERPADKVGECRRPTERRRVRKSLLSPLPKGSPPRAARVKRARAAGIIAADADAGADAAEAAAEHRAQRRARNKVKKREPLFPAVPFFRGFFARSVYDRANGFHREVGRCTSRRS